MNSGTRISRPVSSARQLGDAAACRIAADAGFRVGDRQLHVRRKLDPDRRAVVLLHLDQHIVHNQMPIVAERVGADRQRLERLLIHEVIPLVVGIRERGGHLDEIRLGELLPGLEGLVEHGPRQQVAHLEADERLSTAGRRP